MRRGLTLLLALVVGSAGAAWLLTREDGLPPPSEPAVIDPGALDPFLYDEERRPEFERRAAAGSSHVLYAKSPGGVLATAERTAVFRAQVESAAPAAGIEPDVLEAIVFLESAGRPDAVADTRLEGAVGLTQILAETGQNLLQMQVDPAAARRLSRRIRRAERRGQTKAAGRLRERRTRVDERFDPVKSLQATARYLSFARGRLDGRPDLAVASYHMGVGNLQNVIADFRRTGTAPRSYAELYFGTSPSGRPAPYRRLLTLGDDSSTYYWRVLAAREIMRSYREDPAGLERAAALHVAKGSSEEVLHPPADTESFDDPETLEGAYRDGRIRSFPHAPRLGLARDRRMGELARELEREPRLYRGLRTEAYALAAYMARLVRVAAGSRAPLTFTSTVRDREYQRLLVRRNREATRGYSLHTTGYSFDVLRRYRSRAHAQAFQFALDRLQALNLIAWVREPAAIHVTVSGEARRLEPLLRNEG